jgi:hypothetical protein
MTPEQTSKLVEWNTARLKVDEIKWVIAAEQALRKEIMVMFFPKPVEGSKNIIELNDGWKLKFTYKLDRKIDEAALPAVEDKLREMGVNSDLLVKLVPQLETAVYKSLGITNPEAKKVFEEALIIKPGSHTLELVAPKES